MYGGLFGDLPAARKSSDTNGTSLQSTGGGGGGGGGSGVGDVSKTNVGQETAPTTLSEPLPSSSFHASSTTIASTAKGTKAKTTKVSGASLFVPRFIPSHAAKATKTVAKKVVASSSMSSTQPTAVPLRPLSSSITAATSGDSDRTDVTVAAAAVPQHVGGTEREQGQATTTVSSAFTTMSNHSSAVVDQKSSVKSQEYLSDFASVRRSESSSLSNLSTTLARGGPLSSFKAMESDKHLEAKTTANKGVAAALEHVNVNVAIDVAPQDVYDPMLPNDLLQYWQHSALAKERQQWQQERDAKLQQQSELQQLQDEKQQQERWTTSANKDHGSAGEADTAPTGLERPDKLSSLGRGRGGLSNLPAWLVKQQQEQQQQEQQQQDTE